MSVTMQLTRERCLPEDAHRAILIGREVDQNPMLRHVTPDGRDRDDFVAAVLADLPERPSYFARMKKVNLAPPLL